MDLAIPYKQVSGKDEAWDTACAQITPEYIAKWNIPAEISQNKDSGEISATGKGFTLSLKFTDSECQVFLKLGLLLKPTRSLVLSKVQAKIGEASLNGKSDCAPSGQEIEVDQDTDLLTACREAGVYVKSSCGGHASCSDCIVKILGGEGFLTPPPFEEIQLLGNVFHITKERLACQVKVTGDVTLDLIGHDKSAHEAAFKQKQKQKVLKRKPHERRKPEPVRKKKPVDEALGT